VRDFKELKVWQKAHRFALDVYRESQNFPADERFGLTIQLRRTVTSIASNIAEGCGRGSDPDFARFLCIAAGFASEAEYQLLPARDVEYLQADVHRRLDTEVNEVKRMLYSFIQTLS
jgi:four helix bundle protein